MELEEDVLSYDELRRQIAELEERKKEIGARILARMEEKKIEVGAFTVRRLKRLLIKLSIEEARVLDAISMKETVDRDKIKSILKEGRQIEGVEELETLQVSIPKKSEVNP